MDERLGAVVIGASIGGLLCLWLFGVWGGIGGAILGAIVVSALAQYGGRSRV
jgi:hypothetical protein